VVGSILVPLVRPHPTASWGAVRQLSRSTGCSAQFPFVRDLDGTCWPVTGQPRDGPDGHGTAGARGS